MGLNVLHQRGWIDINKPLWWDLDYSPDPRELVDINEFMERIVRFGRHKYFFAEPPLFVDFNLYKSERVPVTLIDCEIEGEKIPLFATARPYNQMELTYRAELWPEENMRKALEDSDHANEKYAQIKKKYKPRFAEAAGNQHEEYSLWMEYIKELSEIKGYVFLEWHFFPHVRGVFKERVGNHFFWYPVLSTDFQRAIKNSLGRLAYIFNVWVYDVNWYTKVGADNVPQLSTPFQELKNKRLINATKTVNYPTSDLMEVAYDEFIKRLDGKVHLVSVYPVRHPELEETIPLVLSTRTHPNSRRRGATALGVMGNYSHRENYRIWRLRNETFCRDISQTLLDELDCDFDVVCFNQGRYKLVNFAD